MQKLSSSAEFVRNFLSEGKSFRCHLYEKIKYLLGEGFLASAVPGVILVVHTVILLH